MDGWMGHIRTSAVFGMDTDGVRVCDSYTRAFVFSVLNGMAALQLVAIIAE